MSIKHVIFFLIASSWVSAGCKSEDSRPASDCFGYTAPPGWKPTSKSSGTDGKQIIIFGEKIYSLGAQRNQDNFLVRFIPSGGLSLPGYKDFILKALGSADKMKETMKTAEKMRANVGQFKSFVDATTEIKAPVVTDHKVSGRDAYHISSETALAVGEKPVRLITRSVLTKWGSEFIIASAGYPDFRDADLRSLADAFLASVNFDKCK
ncbi:MAG: hypothetical protein HYY84_18915 [Deltaproteobacteria bacterium]|nr:hypothetical protein [Deltaproteobacteria bacterium]